MPVPIKSETFIEEHGTDQPVGIHSVSVDKPVDNYETKANLWITHLNRVNREKFDLGYVNDSKLSLSPSQYAAK
jgi:hypothetical protein